MARKTSVPGARQPSYSCCCCSAPLPVHLLLHRAHQHAPPAQTLPIFVFCFTCHQNIFTICNEIVRPTPARVDAVIGEDQTKLGGMGWGGAASCMPRQAAFFIVVLSSKEGGDVSCVSHLLKAASLALQASLAARIAALPPRALVELLYAI